MDKEEGVTVRLGEVGEIEIRPPGLPKLNL